MKKRIRFKIAFIVIIVLFCSLHLASAQSKFPSRDINIYVGFPPGGTASAQVVLIAETMKKLVDVNVMVQYKPGASQSIAADFVAKSKPDGHTLVNFTVGDFMSKVIKDGHLLNFRLDDLVPIGAANYSAVILAVSAETPWKTFDDLINHAKKVPPGTLSFASTSMYGGSHLAGEALALKTGLVFNHIPFAGGAPAQMAVLGRHADMILGSEGLLSARLKPGGGLRALAVLDEKRLKAFPDVPTLKEMGCDLTFTMWWAIFAPAAIPKDVKEKLEKLYQTAVMDPAVISWMDKTGYVREYLNSDGALKKMKAEFKMYKDILDKIK